MSKENMRIEVTLNCIDDEIMIGDPPMSQSTKVIRTASQQQVRQSCDDEEEDPDDSFDEEDEASPTNMVNLLRL